MELRVNNLTFSYEKQPILQDVSFEIESGSFLTIVGPNGSGKSTLVKCLLGLNPVRNKTIFYKNKDINEYREWKLVGYVPQRFDHINYEIPMIVSELLQTASTKKIPKLDMLAVLDKVNMEEYLNVSIKELSGGQLQRVLIARSLINKPKVLILDEPTVGIDKENIRVFYETLEHLKQDGITIIMITHDQNLDDLPITHMLNLNYLSYQFHPVQPSDNREVVV